MGGVNKACKRPHNSLAVHCEQLHKNKNKRGRRTGKFHPSVFVDNPDWAFPFLFLLALFPKLLATFAFGAASRM
jgi:hypothetical protein